jgi:hypothetical protein
VVLLGVIETAARVLVGPGDDGVHLILGEGAGGLGGEGPRLGHQTIVRQLHDKKERGSGLREDRTGGGEFYV